jgi:hypothetical protein
VVKDFAASHGPGAPRRPTASSNHHKLPIQA